jgi:ClpP class serine protease
MWLLENSTLQDLKAAKAGDFTPSAEHVEQFSAQADAALSVSGSVAKIDISGVLTKNPDIFLAFFRGNTSYRSIISSLDEAGSRADVKSVDLLIDSPGGEVRGLFDVVAALQTFKKPLRAVVDGMAASAAYILASQADKIVATNRGAQLGSIGVAQSFYLDPDIVTITSTEAPKSAPT